MLGVEILGSTMSPTLAAFVFLSQHGTMPYPSPSDFLACSFPIQSGHWVQTLGFSHFRVAVQIVPLSLPRWKVTNRLDLESPRRHSPGHVGEDGTREVQLSREDPSSHRLRSWAE